MLKTMNEVALRVRDTREFDVDPIIHSETRFC